MKLRAEVFDRDATARITQNDRLLEIGLRPHLFRVHAHQSHGVPHALQQVVHPKIHVARDADGIWSSRKCVHFLDRQRVHLVVHVQTAHVLSIPFQDVDELVDVAVLSKQHFGVVYLVLLQHPNHRLFVNFRQPARNGGIQLHSTRLFLLPVNPRRLFIQPQSDGFELARENVLVRVSRIRRLRLARIQHHENQIRRLGHRDNLSSASLTLARAFYDSR